MEVVRGNTQAPQTGAPGTRRTRRVGFPAAFWRTLGILVFCATTASGQVPGLSPGAGEESFAGPLLRRLSETLGGGAYPIPQPGQPGNVERIPLAGAVNEGTVDITQNGDRLNLIVRDAPLSRVLSELAEAHGLNVVFTDVVTPRVSITLYNVHLEDALSSILEISGYRWTISRGIIHVTSVTSDVLLPARIQGKQLRVFTLNYVMSTDLLENVQSMLSPIGRVYILESSNLDTRRTRDVIGVEDLPEVIDRVASYIWQVDQPPRQVMIQAHVLAVNLKDDRKHGVDFDYMFSALGEPVRFRTFGFANASAGQAGFFSIEGTNLMTLIEMLQTTTDAKTLASPRVMVLNGQEARIQVGEQLGFRVTTTTETSTLESVEFLDVGVVLRVIPRISHDGRVLMWVRPEVSSGRVNPDTGLPEEKTTEVETSLLLNHNQAMVIGGLIQEEDRDVQSKLPHLGNLWGIGKLFGRREKVKERSEIIIALVPYVLPYGPENDMRNAVEVERVFTPLLEGPLCRVPRPWEPRLPSSDDRPVRLPPIDRWYRSEVVDAPEDNVRADDDPGQYVRGNEHAAEEVPHELPPPAPPEDAAPPPPERYDIPPPGTVRDSAVPVPPLEMPFREPALPPAPRPQLLDDTPDGNAPAGDPPVGPPLERDPFSFRGPPLPGIDRVETAFWNLDRPIRR